MRAIKSYFVYMPSLYKVLFFGVFPLVAIALEVVLSVFGLPQMAFLLVASIYMFVECFGDSFVLGGLHSKSYSGISLLQSSVAGKGIMRDVIIVDCIRRYISLAIISIVPIIGIQFMSDIEEKRMIMSYMVPMTFMIFCVSTALMMGYCLIGRMICNMGGTMLMGYVISFILGGIVALYMTIPSFKTPILVLASIASIVLAVICVRKGWKQVEGSYYDGTI